MGQKYRKAEVVAEYLKGRVTLRELERRVWISSSTIHRWVKEHEEPKGAEDAIKGKMRRALVVKETELSADVRRLRKELEEARLYNKLLNAMIDIAEDQMGIDVRKKSGAKRRRLHPRYHLSKRLTAKGPATALRTGDGTEDGAQGKSAERRPHTSFGSRASVFHLRVHEAARQ